MAEPVSIASEPQSPPAAAPADRRVVWSGVRRLLALRLDNLGDVLMTTPALAALKSTWPAAHLTPVTSRSAAALAPHLADVDESWSADLPWLAAGTRADAPPASLAINRFIERLRDGRHDAAVIFGVCTQSALPAAMACTMAGIPLRLAHLRENPYRLLSDWCRDGEQVADGMRHEVRRQLDLVAAVGARTDDERLRFSLRARDRLLALDRGRALGLAPGAAVLLVHPGASAASRRWPADRFGAAAALVAAQAGLVPVFIGGAGERDAVLAAAAACGRPAHTVEPDTLGELAGWIDRAALLLANNSGPAHLAAALGTPVVVTYAQTNPQHTPWQVPSRVLGRLVPCRHCLRSVCPQGHHRCLLDIGPADAAAAALELLAASAWPVAPSCAARRVAS